MTVRSQNSMVQIENRNEWLSDEEILRNSDSKIKRTGRSRSPPKTAAVVGCRACEFTVLNFELSNAKSSSNCNAGFGFAGLMGTWEDLAETDEALDAAIPADAVFSGLSRGSAKVLESPTCRVGFGSTELAAAGVDFFTGLTGPAADPRNASASSRSSCSGAFTEVAG